MKACSKCGVVKDLDAFARDGRANDGRRADCKVCNAAKSSAYYAANRRDAVAKACARQREGSAGKREYDAARYAANAERFCKAAAERRAANGQASPYVPLAERRQTRVERTRIRRSKEAARKRAELARACPAWANLDLVAAYYTIAGIFSKATGVPHEVDRREPLRGEHVCGLHNEFNLQVLPASVNRAKSNRPSNVRGVR